MTFPLATALRAGLKNYDRAALRHDLIAGLIVSLVALPLAMALSIAVGLPPQHGLYTAIAAGIVAALCGGSTVQVSGPTAAFVVIVAPIVTEHGLSGLIWCEIMAGAILIIMGMLRLGQYIEHVPHAVTTGFTAGIGVVIATLALNDFLGLDIPQLKGHYLEKAAAIITRIPEMNIYECSVGFVSLLLIVFMRNKSKFIPSPLIGIAVGALLSLALSHGGMEIATIGNRFTFETPTGTGHGIPPLPPMLSIPQPQNLLPLIGPAFVVALLAGLESLLSATVADKMAKTKHDSNAELNGIGIANIMSGLVAGIPATGAIARTATNVLAGARTPLAGAFHGLFLLLYVLALAPLMGYIPMAALAALLIVTAWRMAHAHEFIALIKTGPKSDVAVLLTCFTLTVLIDMVWGVSCGMALYFILKFFAARPRK